MLNQQCERLNQNLVAACKMAVMLIGRQAIAYIRTHLSESPRSICARFRLCAASEKEIKQDGPLCGPCQLGVQLVKDYINRPDDELVAMLNRGCESLAIDLQAPCKMAVMLVGRQAIAYVRGHLAESPRQICARFNLCAASKLIVKLK